MFGLVPVILAAALLYTPYGVAQVYGFVDADGVAHFAAEPLDGRYKRLNGVRTPGWGQSVTGKTNPLSVERLQRHPGLFRYEPLLQRVADEFKLDPALLKAVAAAESGFDARAISAKGAIGLMQVMPATAERFGFAPHAGASAVQRLMDP